MGIRDKLALNFRKALDWSVAHKPPVKSECDCKEECEFYKHLNEIEIGHEDVNAK